MFGSIDAIPPRYEDFQRSSAKGLNPKGSSLFSFYSVVESSNRSLYFLIIIRRRKITSP